MELKTNDLKLILVKMNFSKKVLDYYLRNREPFKKWEPVRQEEFYTTKYHKKALKSGLQKAAEGKEYRFIIFEKNDTSVKKVIGILSFSSIVKGPFL